MSDHWLLIIPTDPEWVPVESDAAAAQAAFSDLCPAGRPAEAEVYEAVTFIDNGQNFDTVHCRACRTEIEKEWWFDEVERAFEDAFSDLRVTTPCCATATSLNDLVYEMPLGFARFQLSVLYPDRGWLTEDELASLAGTLGHPVRQIYRHI